MAVEKDSKLQDLSSSLSRFYRIILGWDYFRLLKDAKVTIFFSPSSSLSHFPSVSVERWLMFFSLFF